MFSFFKKKEAPAQPARRPIRAMHDLNEPFLINLLNGMYVGSEKMDADPERYSSFNQPVEFTVVQELYKLLDKSGLTDYQMPNDATESSWKRLFFRAIFPISWNIAHYMGLKDDEGYVVAEISCGNQLISQDLDKAIGWMRHSDSRLENLVYWVLHANATGGDWPEFIRRDFESILATYSSQVDFAIKGSVKRTKSNVVYVWKALGRSSSDGRHLCKIGVTNVSGGEARLLQVAQSGGFTAEIVVFNMVGESLATAIEKKLLLMGIKPNSGLEGVDGATEFRYLSDTELKFIPRKILDMQEGIT